MAGVDVLLQLEVLRSAVGSVENAALSAYWCSERDAYDVVLGQLKTCADALRLIADTAKPPRPDGGRCNQNEVEINGICYPKEELTEAITA